MKGINILGYYAKDSDGNLHQFEWGKNDEFYINHPLGTHKGNLGHKMMLANPNDYEILQIGSTNSEFN